MSLSVFMWWTLLCINVVKGIHSEQWTAYDGEEYTMANLNITYAIELRDDSWHVEEGEMAKYGTGRIAGTAGILIHIRTLNGSSHHGCELQTAYENSLPSNEPWIALVRRGCCNFDDKLEAAYWNNASGLIVYNNKEDGLQKMTLRNKYRDKLVAVFISHEKGEELSSLVDNGTRVYLTISVGTHYTYRFNNINRTSVMFVSISFIVLMMISLAWLIFYYVQRFRYLHAKDRLSKQLTSAAQKALSKIPTEVIKSSDKEVGEAECCAVCIEPYKSGDVVRLLPCRHEFHKVCVDPWLLEHRTCPMCKMDILKHYGYVFTGSQESIINMDMEAPIIPNALSRRDGSAPNSPFYNASQTVVQDPSSVQRGQDPNLLPERRTWTWGRGLRWGRNSPENTTVTPTLVVLPSQTPEISPSQSQLDNAGTVTTISHAESLSSSALQEESFSAIDSTLPLTPNNSADELPSPSFRPSIRTL